MKLTGLHFLLTYQCTMKCDHCFTWGSPWQQGVMTLDDIRNFLRQATQAATIERIAFEGGEPFLYYPILLAGTRAAAELGFEVSIVTNAFWATSDDDALEWLRPFAGMLKKLSISSDLLHWQATISPQALHARAAAEALGIDTGLLSTAHPLHPTPEAEKCALPAGQGGVMFRGRAAHKLAPGVTKQPWRQFTTCAGENLREPARAHLDPFGNLHICQGIVIGNLFHTPLAEIIARFVPESHPVIGPLLEGGPAELVHRYALPHQQHYVDACHLCDAARQALRARFPKELAPDQIYGVDEQGRGRCGY